MKTQLLHSPMASAKEILDPVGHDRIYMPGDTDPTIHKQPVSSCGSILLGELIPIKWS